MAYVLIYRDISNGKIKSRFNDIRELCRFFKMLFYLHLVEANLTQSIRAIRFSKNFVQR